MHRWTVHVHYLCTRLTVWSCLEDICQEPLLGWTVELDIAFERLLPLLARKGNCKIACCLLYVYIPWTEQKVSSRLNSCRGLAVLSFSASTARTVMRSCTCIHVCSFSLAILAIDYFSMIILCTKEHKIDNIRVYNIYHTDVHVHVHACLLDSCIGIQCCICTCIYYTMCA